MSEKNDALTLRTAGALLGTVPIALLVSVSIARFAPVSLDRRIALALFAAIPAWVLASSLAFVARSGLRTWIVAIVASLALAWLLQAPARAQDAAPVLLPPRLVLAAEPLVPEGAAVREVDVDVLLLVTLDAEGRVTDAQVVESVGPELDAIALDAARRSLFEPARRDGVAMPSRIRFACRIPASVVAPEPVPEAPVEAPVEAAPALEAAPIADEATPDVPEVIDVEAVAEGVEQRRERSAEAVDVVELDRARRTTADLGEVLAHREGVSVRRSGGLGGQLRFSLNGLSDDRIRVFLDGVPLDLAGYPMSFGNVPVQIVDHVELYRGVLPIRFGADALGGAVQLLTRDPGDRPSLGVAYQVGSFGTHRVSLRGEARTRRGFFARANGFLDSARNDFPIHVRIAGDDGRLRDATVRRFHDAYFARGGSAELGVLRRGRIERLSLRGFGTVYDKDLQNNNVMSIPYGGVTYGESVYGLNARAELRLGSSVTFTGVAGYARRSIDFEDVSRCVYDWNGDCVRMRAQPGEIEAGGYDQTIVQDTGFARLLVGWDVSDDVAIHASVAPTYATRTGTDRTILDPNGRDPLASRRDLFTLVAAIEGTGRFLDDRLEAIAFAKGYVYRARSEEVLPGNRIAPLARDTSRLGAGASVRYAFDPDLYVKASYEYTTRLPTVDETFGNGVLVQPNLRLDPEISHNLNLGVTIERTVERVGGFRAELSTFGRFTDRLILLLGTDRDYSNQNVYGARSIGFEVEGRYTAPHEHAVLSANLTYQDFRNTSSEGTFGAFEGARISNQPSLFFNVEARGRLADLWLDDELSLAFTMRFVDGYYRGWSTLGTPSSKQSIPAQIVPSATLAYAFRTSAFRGSASFEARNLGNARVFDFYGVQRPGRAFYLQLTFDV